jgi:UDP-GlcNAc:undecaprenyl-phosphate/decaprenyl-phosphate GlcNAc-1-phosphate transferase
MTPVWILPPVYVLVAFGLSILIAILLMPLAIKGGPVDIPRARGSHFDPTPTSGGLAVIAASGLSLGALLVWGKLGYQVDNLHYGVLLFGFAILMGLSGAIDDVFDLPAKGRLLFQFILCLGFAYHFPVTEMTFGPVLTIEVLPIVGILGSALWLILGINAINFMDGANGLAVGTQIVCLSVFVLIILLFSGSAAKGLMLGGVLLVLICSAGSFVGLLPFNLPMGRLFQGDAGSLFGGAIITGTTLILTQYAVASVWLGGFLLAPLLVDVVMTLGLRTLQKKNLFEAHKDHLYQQWLLHKDPSHLKLSLRVWGLVALSSGIGIGARMIDETYNTDIRFIALLLIIIIYSVGWVWLRRTIMPKAINVV